MKSYFPTVTEAYRYIHYRDVVTYMYDNIEELKAGKLENPYSVDEFPEQYKRWLDIEDFGAAYCLTIMTLNEQTLENHVRQTFLNDKRLEKCIKKFSKFVNNEDGYYTPGSDAHLESILDFQKSRLHVKPGEAATETLKAYAIAKAELVSAIHDQDELEKANVIISQYCHPSANEDLMEMSVIVDTYNGGLKYFHAFDDDEDDENDYSMELFVQQPVIPGLLNGQPLTADKRHEFDKYSLVSEGERVLNEFSKRLLQRRFD